jgi:hypothetical protein
MEYMVSRPEPTCRPRSIPTERMLRSICRAGSSKLTYSARSPRAHAASVKAEPSVVFAVPGCPVTSTLDPRK